MTAMESVASHLDEQTGFFLSHESLRSRIAQAEAALDVAITDAARRAAEAAAAAHSATIADDSPEGGLAAAPSALAELAAPRRASAADRYAEVESIDDLLAVQRITLAKWSKRSSRASSRRSRSNRALLPADPVIETDEPVIDFVLSENPATGRSLLSRRLVLRRDRSVGRAR